MSIIISLLKSSFEQGLLVSLTTLALFLSYLMLNVCDLSTDGCFTLGAVVGLTIVNLTASAPAWMEPMMPYISIAAAMLAGAISGFVVSILQTTLGVNSLLAGIIVNTALYSVNIAIMKGATTISIVKIPTVFSNVGKLFKDTPVNGYAAIFVLILIAALVILFQWGFLRTRTGLAIRATGNNPDMVRSSSISPVKTTITGLCIANSFTALSGCLMGQLNASADINIGTGMVTVALASLLIGNAFLGKCRIPIRLIGMVLGSFVFYLVYSIALRFNIPAYMFKLVSAVIVLVAISAPYLASKLPLLKRRLAHDRGGSKNA